MFADVRLPAERQNRWLRRPTAPSCGRSVHWSRRHRQRIGYQSREGYVVAMVVLVLVLEVAERCVELVTAVVVVVAVIMVVLLALVVILQPKMPVSNCSMELLKLLLHRILSCIHMSAMSISIELLFGMLFSP